MPDPKPTKEEIVAAYKRISEYINAADSSRARNRRKAECFFALYSSDMSALVEFANKLPKSDAALH